MKIPISRNKAVVIHRGILREPIDAVRRKMGRPVESRERTLGEAIRPLSVRPRAAVIPLAPADPLSAQDPESPSPTGLNLDDPSRQEPPTTKPDTVLSLRASLPRRAMSGASSELPTIEVDDGFKTEDVLREAWSSLSDGVGTSDGRVRTAPGLLGALDDREEMSPQDLQIFSGLPPGLPGHDHTPKPGRGAPGPVAQLQPEFAGASAHHRPPLPGRGGEADRPPSVAHSLAGTPPRYESEPALATGLGARTVELRTLSGAEGWMAAARLHHNLGQAMAWMALDEQAEWSRDQIEWNDRLSETEMILNGMDKKFATSDGVIGCFLDGEPIGLALLKKPVPCPPLSMEAADDTLTHVGVSDFVTHPGSAGAGGLLIEQAVAASMAWECQGKIRLLPLSVTAEGAYGALGFVPKDGASVLSPADSSKWTDAKGPWLLKKYAEKMEAGPLGPSATVTMSRGRGPGPELDVPSSSGPDLSTGVQRPLDNS